MIQTVPIIRCVSCGTLVRQGVVCPHCANGEPEIATNGAAATQGDAAVPIAPDGDRVTIEELYLGDLEVPREYQRQLKERTVRQIVANFDSALVGVLTVGRDAAGRLWLIDGQHRWEALVELGHERWHCEVLHGLSISRQAGIYTGRNTRRIAIDRLDAFRAAHVAGDPAARAIAATLSRHGYGVAGHSGRRTADQVGCVGALREINSWGDLDETMATVRAAWSGDIDATLADLLQGVAAVLHLHSEVNRRDLVRDWSRVTVAEVLSGARLRSAGTSDRRRWTHVAAVLVETYNRGRRAGHRLPLAEIPLLAARDWKRSVVVHA
jgi:hypothetical protein